MPPFLLSPLVKWALIAAGGAHGRALGGEGNAPDQRRAGARQARGADLGSREEADLAARSLDRRIPALAPSG